MICKKIAPPERVVFFMVLNEWTIFTMFKLHLRSFAIAHRRALARLLLVVKQLPRWFSNHHYPTTKKTTRKGGVFYGRNDWTRTSDLFVPNEAFYQAELHSVSFRVIVLTHFFYKTSKIFKKIQYKLK